MHTKLSPFSIKLFSVLAIIALALAGLPALPVHAAACTFTSAATGNWDAASTWTPAGTGCSTYPGQTFAGDIVNISNGHTVTLNVSPAQSIASITFPTNNNTATNLNFNSGTSLTVTGTITIPRGATVTNTLAVGAGTLTAGSLAFTNGGYQARHQLTISTGTVTITGDVTQAASTHGATITFTGAGTLNLGGAIYDTLTGTLNVVPGSTVNYNGANQTVSDFAYENLTLSGSGVKTIAPGATVNGNLTTSGTVTVATPGNMTIGGNTTVGSGTTLTVAPGFTFTATGATSVSGTFVLDGTATKTFTGNVTINNGGTWNETGISSVYFGGNLQNNGTFNVNTGTHYFSGTGKTINGTNPIVFTTMSISGSVTNNGNLSITTNFWGAGSFTNGATGTVNFGGAGTINPIITASAAGNKFYYSRAGTQTVQATTYSNLYLSGSGGKAITTGTAIDGTIDISGTAKANIGAGLTIPAGALSFAGAPQVSGTWGSTTSTATNKNNTYFSATTGMLNVGDTTPPDTSITSNPTNPSSSTTASFSFTGTDSGSGVASYQCQIDGGAFAACTSPKSYTGLANGSHTFQVRAIDVAGNIDPTPASFTWTISTTAPDTNITSNPTNPTNSTTATFSFAGVDTGGGIASFQCQLDGSAFTTCTSPQNYTGLANGSHTFQVRAVDGLGTADPTPASFTWTIDTTIVDTTINTKPSSPTNSTTAAFTFSSTDPAATFQCSLDGATFVVCTSPQTYNGLSAGSHTFQVRAVDGGGTVDPSPASFTWTIDLGYPTLSSSTPLNNASVTTALTNLTVTFSKDVKNDGTAGAANILGNYLLVEDGANSTFDTMNCAGGLIADDTKVTMSSVAYTNNGGSGPFVATLNFGALPDGKYRLFICGTTSIEDLSGNKLNNGASDAQVNFTVAITSQTGGGTTSTGTSSTKRKTATSSTLPVTGFPKNQVTSLPVQPADKAYSSSDLVLEIPSLGVKMSILGVPFKDNNWDVTWLDKNAGWLNGSAYPTWNGNSVITGHVWDALNQPGPFVNLKNLKFGDQVRIHNSGQVYIYEVRETTSVTPGSVSTVFKHEDKSWVTLITCEKYQEATQTYSSRRMVRAVLVSVISE